MYAIGQKTFFRGQEITITTEPYYLHGATWQDGITESGKIFTVRSLEEIAKRAERTKSEWAEQQTAFRGLA